MNFHNLIKMEASQGPAIDVVLSGNTLGERHRSLNQLVHRATDDILSSDKLINIHSKTQLELVFLAKVADCKRNPRVICQLLQSEYLIVLHTALHAKWLFKGTIYQDYSNAKYFVEEIFPHVSHHAVCRIVGNFGAYLKNEEVANEFFKLVKDLYGWKLGIKLLPACTTEMISCQLKVLPYEIPSGILLKIYLKEKNSAIEYLKGYYEYFYGRNHTSKIIAYDEVFQQMAWNTPVLLIDLLKRYPHATRMKEVIGNKATKYVLDNFAGEVIKYAKHLQYSMNNKTIIKTLKGKELEDYLLNALPDEYDLLPYTLPFNYLNEREKALILFKIHPLKYNGQSILDRTNYFNSNQIRYIPKDARIAWAQEKLSSIVELNLRKPYYQYLDPETASSEWIKNIRSVDETFEMLKEMTNCFVINNDENGLIKTITEMTSTLNSNPALTENCIHFLCNLKHLYKVFKVSDVLWSAVSGLIQSTSCSYALQEKQKLFLLIFICDELLFYVHRGLNLNKIIPKLINNYSLNILQSYIFDILNKIRKSEQKVILVRTIVANLRIKLLVENDLTEVWKYIIFVIRLYNEIKKRGRVSFTEWEWLINLIYKNMFHWQGEPLRILMTEIYKDWNGRKLFIKEIYKHSLETGVLYWLLNNNIDFISTDVTTLSQYFTHQQIPIQSKQRQTIQPMLCHVCIHVRFNAGFFNDFSLPQQIFNQVDKLETFSKRIRFFNKLQVYFYDTLRVHSITVLNEMLKRRVWSRENALHYILLTLLVNSQTVKTMTEASLPNRQKPHKEFYDTIPKLLKYIDPPVSYGIIMKYLGQCNFNSIETSVMSVVHKKSLKDTRVFIDDLRKESVIMKRLGVNLSFKVIPKKELLSFYIDIWNQNMNSQIKTIILKKTMKLLLNEDKEQNCYDIWKNIEYFIGSCAEIHVHFSEYIKESDKMARKEIIFSDYCETSWKILKETGKSNKNCVVLRKILVDCICKNMNIIKDKYIETCMVDYWNHLEVLDTLTVNELLPFVIAYIMKPKYVDTTDRHLCYICDKFKQSISHFWNTSTDGIYLMRNYLKDFVIQLCKELAKNYKENTRNYFQIFNKFVFRSIPTGDDKIKCIVYVLMNLTKLYINLKHYNTELKHIAQEQIILNNYSTKINEKFGETVLEFFNNSFQKEYSETYVSTFFEYYALWITFLTDGKSDEVKQDIIMSVLAGFNLINTTDELVFLQCSNLLPVSLYKGSKYTNLYNIINEKLHRIITSCLDSFNDVQNMFQEQINTFH